MKNTKSIKKNHLFKGLYNKGKSNVSPYFALYSRKNRPFEGNEGNFLGITVGVKLGNAVCRNKVRRRISAIYRLEESNIKKGYHIVVVARNRCANAKYSQMEESLLRLLDQAGLTLTSKFPLEDHKKRKKGKTM
ncbi:MAG: ribonuclease P protein component [Eubacteriales bacterium]